MPESKAPAKLEPQIIEGYRIGSRFRTDAGWFTNGTAPTTAVAEALKAAGYSLTTARQSEAAEAAKIEDLPRVRTKMARKTEDATGASRIGVPA